MLSISLNNQHLQNSQTSGLDFSDSRRDADGTISYHSLLNDVIKDLQLHILLADDDPDDILVFQLAIAEIAPLSKISVVNDGNEALKFLKKQQPDLIFLDINMPCKNGIECLEEIRSDDAFNDLPVIIYSTTINISQLNASFNKGASLYMQKPTNYEDIKKSISSILSDGLATLSAQRNKSTFLLKVK